MRVEAATRTARGLLWGLSLALALAGCATGGDWETVGTDHKCVDDSPNCIAHRQNHLKAMLSDKERKWVREPATADAYAGGTRLFAYKQRKRELSCAELAAGKREADAGPGVLRGSAGRHLTPAQVSRGAMLAVEVSRELGAELKRRCQA